MRPHGSQGGEASGMTSSAVMSGAAPARQGVSDVLAALFLDIPYILDSSWRRIEFRANRLYDYSVDTQGVVTGPDERPYWHQPPFWLFIATLVFVAFGPTFDALCAAVGDALARRLRTAGAWVCLLVGVVQLVGTGVYATQRAIKRFRHQNVTSLLRRGTAGLVLASTVVLAAAPWFVLAGDVLSDPERGQCVPESTARYVWSTLGVLAAASLVAWSLARRSCALWLRIVGESAVLALLVIVLWAWIIPEGARESLQAPYVHVYGVVALALAAVACLAPVLIRIPFHSLTQAERQRWQEALSTEELFPGERRDPDLSWRRVFGALVLGVLRYPLHGLLLPALFIILSPPERLGIVTIASGALSLLLLTVGSLSSRWHQMIVYVERWFLTGTPLVVSLFAITVALLRLAGVHYVSTLLDVAPFGILLSWIVIAYALFWWFENHINAVAVARLLDMIGASRADREPRVAYRPGADYENTTGTTVERDHRWLVAHGAGRVAVLGWFRAAKTGQPTEAFYTYSLGGLVTRLLGHRQPDMAHDMMRRLQLYFALVNLLLIGLAVVLGWQFGRAERTNTSVPVVEARAEDPSGTPSVQLSVLLAEPEGGAPPALVIAASGGGTRAALYTATALAGLSDLGHDRNIVLLSGVSGGGVAAAYFYGHRRELLDPQTRTAAWEQFLQRMQDPFISDVLEGATEWRIFTDHPLSVLLAESFERRLFSSLDDATLGRESEVALLLNTTLVGHPRTFSTLLGESFPAPVQIQPHECPRVTRPFGNLAGGRLVFTNLHAGGTEPWERLHDSLPDVRLPFVLVTDPSVRLAAAAALTANFPPVFPNARVNIERAGDSAMGCPEVYFVTDGGAMENLGLISALMAIRAALGEMQPGQPVRDIHVIALEASAFSYDYRQDRGLAALTGGARERLAGLLTVELLEDIQNRLARIDPEARLRVHYLPLPTVFRSRGAFGTHWMAPKDVRLQAPWQAHPDGGWSRLGRCTLRRMLGNAEHPCAVTLEREQMVALWRQLFSVDADFCTRARRMWEADGPEAARHHVVHWICGRQSAEDGEGLPPADRFIDEWAALVAQLRSAPSS